MAALSWAYRLGLQGVELKLLRACTRASWSKKRISGDRKRNTSVYRAKGREEGEHQGGTISSHSLPVSGQGRN